MILKVQQYVILVFLLLPLSYSQCSNCVSLSYYSCQICYNNCTTDEAKQFQSCTQQVCLSTSMGADGSNTCDSYEKKQLSQAQCFPKCCQLDETHFSAKQLKYCDEKSQKNSKILTIVLSCVFSIIALVFFICCFRSVCRNGGLSNFADLFRCCHSNCCTSLCQCLTYIFTCRCFRNNIEERPDVNIYAGIELQRKNIEWQQKKANEAMIYQNCPICLNSNTNTITPCGHFFHLQCIYQWYKRNQSCPLCKNETIQQVKCCCKICLSRSAKINLKYFQTVNEIMVKINGLKCGVCQ